MSSQPCRECRPILGSLSVPHTVENCALRKLRYCGICAVYGHNEHNCPDEGAMEFREPLYIEQLIPSNTLMEYNIQSATPLPAAKKIKAAPKPILVVPETEEAIRAALMAVGEKPMICQQKGRTGGKELLENKKRLQKVADIYGRRLIFVDNPTKPLADTVPPKKK